VASSRGAIGGGLSYGHLGVAIGARRFSFKGCFFVDSRKEGVRGGNKASRDKRNDKNYLCDANGSGKGHPPENMQAGDAWFATKKILVKRKA